MSISTVVPVSCLLILTFLKSDKISHDFDRWTTPTYNQSRTAVWFNNDLAAKDRERRNDLSWRDSRLNSVWNNGEISEKYNNVTLVTGSTELEHTTQTEKTSLGLKLATIDMYDVLRPGFVGKPIMMEDFPFVATIWLRYERPEYHAVGTLVSKRHVLTAAHSVCWRAYYNVPVPISSMMMAVRVGTMNYNESFVEHDVQLSYIHWRWWASTRKNRLYDVAVLELAKEVLLTPRSGLVNLANPWDLNLLIMMKSFSSCITVWWGVADPGGSVDPKYPYLQAAETKLITFTECQQLLKKYGGNEINTTIEICTSAKDMDGPCQGDIGAPLICEGKQVGVSSWGPGCIKNDQPQVHTRIDVLYDWIRFQTSRLENLSLENVKSKADQSMCAPLLIVLMILVIAR